MAKSYDRDRTQHLLRYIFRRKQCAVILLVQIVLLILFITVIIVLLHSTANLNMKEKPKALSLQEKYIRLKRENNVLAQYENFSTFFSCKYHPPTEYDVSDCGWANDESSFMVRYHRRRTDSYKCAPRIDMIPCDVKYPDSYKQSQDILKNTILNRREFISDYRPCPGIRNNTVGWFGVSPQTPILAPKIKNIDQFDKRLMLRPKDFIMLCPMCMTGSKFSSNMRKNYCARRVKTLREGWPQDAMVCDEIENHPFAQFCNTHDILMNKIHGIAAPVINNEADYDEDLH